jgi:hypothetical protein
MLIYRCARAQEVIPVEPSEPVPQKTREEERRGLYEACCKLKEIRQRNRRDHFQSLGMKDPWEEMKKLNRLSYDDMYKLDGKLF